MAEQKFENSKKIEQDRWVEFFDMLSNGNRGRRVSLEVIDPEMGDKTPIKDAALFSVVCDPVGKGNDIIIETGEKQVNYAHTVNSPTEAWEAQDENGELIALQLNDESGAQTILRFS